VANLAVTVVEKLSAGFGGDGTTAAVHEDPEWNLHHVLLQVNWVLHPLSATHKVIVQLIVIPTTTGTTPYL
jgi:hypothetical protein